LNEVTRPLSAAKMDTFRVRYITIYFTSELIKIVPCLGTLAAGKKKSTRKRAPFFGSKSHHLSGGTKLFFRAYYPARKTSGGSFHDWAIYHCKVNFIESISCKFKRV